MTEKNDRLYLDHAASSPLRMCARQAWLNANQFPANPSSRHQDGMRASDLFSDARATVKLFLGDDYEVVFTSGGTESIILSVLGALSPTFEDVHLVATQIDHSAVLGLYARLEQLGVTITLIQPTRSGLIRPQDVERALQPNTHLVCMQHANNETGVIQPVEEVSRVIRQHKAILLIDAVQTAGKIPLATVDADLMAVSAHKFGGPRGIGALRIRPGLKLAPIIMGASHESGLRAGTENVAGAAGMAAAAEECMRNELSTTGKERIKQLRRYWEKGLAELEFECTLVSDAPTLSETICILIPGVRGDAVADGLDLLGISVGTGSACHASDFSPSHVLTSMGLERDAALSAIRISFGLNTTEEEIDRVMESLDLVVRRLRSIAGL